MGSQGSLCVVWVRVLCSCPQTYQRSNIVKLVHFITGILSEYEKLSVRSVRLARWRASGWRSSNETGPRRLAGYSELRELHLLLIAQTALQQRGRSAH